MEEEAREILKSGLRTRQAARPGLGESIRRRFAPLGGMEIELPPREPIRDPPKFTK
jgi:antitoxin FitA